MQRSNLPENQRIFQLSMNLVRSCPLAEAFPFTPCALLILNPSLLTVFFDLVGIFCYDAVISGFPLQPFPWIEIQVASPKLGNKNAG